MNPERGTTTARFVLGLSALLMAICVITGLALVFSPNQGGFFPGLARALGLVLIAAGNLITWVLNLFAWLSSRWRWLGIVVAVQTLPALAMAGWLLFAGVESFSENRAYKQRDSITDAIKADDVAAMQQALNRCGTLCQTTISPSRQLLYASMHGAHQVASLLIDGGAQPYRRGSGSTEFYDASFSLYTCEGRFLPMLNALDLAIANRDMAMLELLWPVSDDWTRNRAILIAAELDRLEILKTMLAWQPGHTETPELQASRLLQAAASGAAMDTGRWLLESQPSVLEQTDIQDALNELLRFMADVYTPRSVEFGQLLQQHGADIHIVTIDNKPALLRAVQTHSGSLVRQLLDLGLQAASLSNDDATALETLLEKPERYASSRHNHPDCIDV